MPLTVSDFIDRAVRCTASAPVLSTSPTSQPVLGELTYAELARRPAAGGDSTISVSARGSGSPCAHNSARLLTAFFGVGGSGRVLVPVNFRLPPTRCPTSSSTPAPGALVDPSSTTRSPTSVRAPVRDRGRRTTCSHEFTGPARRGRSPDENATATINYTSGTTARPKGVQLTHRNIWTNAVTFGLHAGVSDRDVYLHTLPMFHGNGWGMPFVMTGLGARRSCCARSTAPRSCAAWSSTASP